MTGAKRTADGPFDGLRVLEIGEHPAASFCARMFGDFGADVFKLGSFGGHPSSDPASAFEGERAMRDAWATFLDANKRLIPADAVPPASRRALIAGCDVLITGEDAPWAEDAARANPDLVHVDVSWFGRSGPYAAFAATDAVCRALAGCVQLVGPPEGPPLSAPDYQAGIVGGLWAYIAALAGLLARGRDGARRFEASAFEACVTLAEYQIAEAWARGAPQARAGVNRFPPTYPLGVYPTRDDWLGVTLVTPAQWRTFCAMVGLAHLGVDERCATGLDRIAIADELEAQFIPRLRERPAADWFAEGLRRKLPCVVLPSLEALIRSDELRRRGAIVPIAVGSRIVTAPGSPLRLQATPPRAEGTLNPVLNDDAAWPAREGRPSYAAPAAPKNPAAPKGAPPLSGVRIVDFTMGWAGPLCTRTLADLGAEIIKIESCSYPDWWRGVDRRPHVLREKLYEKVARFALLNRNKTGVTIDLTRPEGVELAKSLVMWADAVADNYSVDVLPKFGLGPDALRALKPGLVTLSMSAYGASSSWRECRAYGSTLEQGSGLPLLVGEEGGPPVMGHPAYGDPVGGLNGAAALLTALAHARRTGQGQHIDLSQVECMMGMTAPWMIAQSAGAPPVRYGARHPDHAPHGICRCAGEDEWLLLAVTGDEQWRGLCAVIERPDLAADSALADAAGRRARAGMIDAAIAAWTATRPAREAMDALQGAGVAAGRVGRPADLLGDPHLVSRGFWRSVERPYLGPHPQPSPAIREGDAPFPVRRAAPTLGEGNRAVFGSILGLSEAEIAALEKAGVIGSSLVVAQDERPERVGA